jgi:hypothetical protein
MLSLWFAVVDKTANSNSNKLKNQDKECVLSLAILRTHNIWLTKQRRRVQG